MPKRGNKGAKRYAILGSPQEMNLRFYEGYDENLLYNKAVTLLYVIDNEDEIKPQVEAHLREVGGGALSDKYLEALRAELFFTALHQCEGFFALLFAALQPLPHWMYLTDYKPGDIPQLVDKLLACDISDLTEGRVDSAHEFLMSTLYNYVMPSDPDQASRWEENLENAWWIIQRLGRFYRDNDRAYNSYKHGLRVMTGRTYFAVAPQDPSGRVQGPM